MTKMIQYVDEMRERLTEVAKTEQTLIRALGEALSQVDQELLADVRDLTLAHEARRVAILDELQTLASRIGAFPVAREAPSVIEGSQQPPSSALPADTPESGRAGDWRQAVSNIKEDLDAYFNRGIQH